MNNYGFYIIGFIMLLYVITIFIFWFKSYQKLKVDLFNIYITLKKCKSIDNKPIIEENKEDIKMDKLILKGNNSNNINLNIQDNSRNNSNHKKYINSVKQTAQDNQDQTSNKLNITKISKFKLQDLNIINRIDFLEQKDFEINSLDYELAFKLDKRNYFQYYISLLKYNHPLMFSFGNYNDYNSRIIKIFLFFFSFSSDLTINALFFNDDTMHKIYQDKGEYDLLYQIPQILYSALISKLIDALIKNLALSQDNIVELKQEKEKNNLEEKYDRILKIIRMKIISFFVISFIILLFFWYYIACFCCIYVNTQIHLIKDTFISLIASLIYPFAINLIPGIFRITSLKMENHSGKYLYTFSSFLGNNLA